MLEQIFIKVVNMSITAGYCVVIVLLLRMCIRKLPRIYSYVLWAAVFFRLVCPISLESTFSILKVKPETIPYHPGNLKAPESVSESVNASVWMEHIAKEPSQKVEASANIAAGHPMQQLLLAASVLWLAVLCILVAGSVWSYVRLRLQLRDAVWMEKGVYKTDKITTPFVVGIFKPGIYLPMEIGEENKRFVLEHEKTHIRRKDYLVKQAAFLICCVHWFHPLVWAAFYLMCTDMEMACDESVIRKLGKDMRKPYSAALLSLSSGRKIILGTPLAFGEDGVRRRIVNVLRYKKRSVWASVLILALIAVATIALVFNPKENRQEKDYVNKKTASQLENIKMASGVMPLPDGSDVTVELWMKEGTYYNESMDEYAPSIYTYPQNYEGNYILRTSDGDGNILFETGLEQLWPYRGTVFNFSEEFSLKWTDYNEDGCPDFTLGLPQSSSTRGYLLLTVREDGRLERLCSGDGEISIENSLSEGVSMILEQDEKSGQKTIIGSFYNHAVGELYLQYYDYNPQSKFYEPGRAKRYKDVQRNNNNAQSNEQKAAVSVSNDTEDARDQTNKISETVRYEGYMDEFPNESRQIYRKLDLDGDGKTYRVYRKVKENTASFEIQFGNGKNLFLGEFGIYLMTPGISSVKITGSNQSMILFTGIDLIEGSVREGNIALYTQFGGEYEKYELTGDDGGPYLDSQKMRAGYPSLLTYDAQRDVMKLTFQNTNRFLEWTPQKNELDDDYSFQNHAAYSAQFVSYKGENGVAFYQYARDKEQSKLFCYVLSVRENPLRSDWTPYDMKLLWLGWADETMMKEGFTLPVS